MAEPIPLRLNDANMLRLIREIAADTSRVFLRNHAKRRMRERGITRMQVYACLRNGQISEHAHEGISGDWRCTLIHRYAGDEVSVVAAIEKDDDDNWIAVVTVF